MSYKISIEAFAKYHRTKEGLAELVQIATAAFSLLKINVSVSNGAELLGAFVDSCEVNNWGKGKTFPKPVEKTNKISDMFCRHMLVQHVSAFDLFTISVVSDFSKFSSWARNNIKELNHNHQILINSPQGRWVSPSCCKEMEDKLGDLKNRVNDLEKLIGWKPSDRLKQIIPLLDLARMARNRIVHSDSIVGSDLQEYSNSQLVKNAFEFFQKNYTDGKIPKLPIWLRGNTFDLSPVNVIFFGAVINEFAKEINSYVVSKIENKEFVEMAFYYASFIETHPDRIIKHRTPEGRIQHFLTNRYLFSQTVSNDFILQSLKQIKISDKSKTTDLWKINLDRHDELKKIEANHV